MLKKLTRSQILMIVVFLAAIVYFGYRVITNKDDGKLRASGTIVVGSRAEIPAVEVPAHDDDLVGMLRADQLSDHVVGDDWRQRLARRDERELGVGILAQRVAQAFGRERGDRDGRDLRRRLVVAHRAGVRVVIQLERERSDNRRHGSGTSGRHGTGRSL